MRPDQLPAEVAGFLLDCIESVEQLDVLLLLHDHPNRDWTVAEINRELRSTEVSVRKRLEALVRSKVINSPAPTNGESIRYSPANPETAARIDQLARYYRQYQYRVIDLIFSKPKHRARSFADAFRFTKGEEE